MPAWRPGRLVITPIVLAWLRSRLTPSLPPPPAPADERPAWVGELLDALQKQTRAAAKQAARFEAGLGELDARVIGLAESIKKSASSAVPAAQRARYDEVFDALDALDEAQLRAVEPHLAQGLTRVSERLLRFCERAGYSRIVPRGEQPDPRVVRVVGSEPGIGVDRGRVTRVVRAAVVAGAELVREGEVIVSSERAGLTTEGAIDEHCLGD